MLLLSDVPKITGRTMLTGFGSRHSTVMEEVNTPIILICLKKEPNNFSGNKTVFIVKQNT